MSVASISCRLHSRMNVNSARTMEVSDTARWPLAFCLQPPTPKAKSLESYGFATARLPRRWWSHRLYRGSPGNKEVEILYSRTKAQSEIIAKQFLNEPIVGFDMEWPWNDWKRDDLQNKVGLIQIASEAKIALFHIGLHPGKKTDDIIAPTLRQIIESPSIGKVGVNILKADFARLHRFFGLNPKGAIESSHLYRLVKFGARKPELVSVKLVSLAHQVEDQLGLPLYKGDVRTSNWSKPLSKDQIDYAAGDAYAGFMLYHCMNAKRVTMNPVPPLPVHADKYPPGKASKDDPILLEGEEGNMTTSAVFFGVKPAKSIPAGSKEKNHQKKVTVSKSSVSRAPLDHLSQALYEELIIRRATLAEHAKVPANRIIADALLEALACERPLNTESLLSIKGIGKVQQQKYGADWLEVISLFLASNGILPAATVAGLSEPKIPLLASTPRRKMAQKAVDTQDSSDSSPAFEPPLRHSPHLHTGISFTLTETKLDVEVVGSASDVETCDSDDSLPSLDFGSPSRRKSPQLKRKRPESPIQQDDPTIPYHMQQLEGSCDSNQGGLSSATACRAMQQIPRDRSNAAILTPRSKLSRNKLLAFSRLVARKLPLRPVNAPSIVAERTLDLLVQRAPQTQEELEKIPGIDSFLLACEQTNTDLLKNIIKFAPSR